MSLDALAREGARRMLAAALEAEVDEHGHRLVRRKRSRPARQLATGAGQVEVVRPRVDDRRVDPAASRTEPRSRRRDGGLNTERFGFMSFTRKEAGLETTPDANGPAVAPAAAAGRIELGGEVIVNRLGFGAMRLARPGIPGGPQDDAEARRVLRRAVQLGVGFIDTAHAYGASERLIAEALHPYPDGLIVATKGGLGGSGAEGRPEAIRRHCERSLTVLRREVIDLYQLHTVDPRVRIEESLGAIVDLQREGKVRMIGVSNVSVAELERARTVADIVSVQNRYSVGDRRSDDVLESCERDGIAFLPWFPLGAGRLARAQELERVADSHGASAAQVAIAWLLQRSPMMLPIPGTSSLTHLEENVAAAALRLSEGEVARLTG
jgi:pyridoxine 4-dehydrogenase